VFFVPDKYDGGPRRIVMTNSCTRPAFAKPFFCLTSPEPVCRPDRKFRLRLHVEWRSGWPRFRCHPRALSLTPASTMAPGGSSDRKTPISVASGASISSPRAIVRGFPVPVHSVSTEVPGTHSGSPSIISISRPSTLLLLLTRLSGLGSRHGTRARGPSPRLSQERIRKAVGSCCSPEIASWRPASRSADFRDMREKTGWT